MMNNAAGLKIQATPSIDARVAGSGGTASLVQGCETGDCSNQNTGDFLATLNAELDALTDIESIDFLALAPALTTDEILEDTVFNSENSKRISGLDESQLALSQPQWVLINNTTEKYSQWVESGEQQNNDVFNQNLDVLVQHILQELPETVTALPLTPENKAFIRQQAIALLEQQQPELMAKIRQAEGQKLPLEGNIMPNTAQNKEITDGVIKTLQTERATSLPEAKSSLHNNMSEDNSVMTDKVQEESEAYLASEHEPDNDMASSIKRFFEPANYKGELVNEPHVFNDIVQKVNTKDMPIQKLATETLVTPLNSTLAVNQGFTHHLTPASISTATILHLPQNPSPEQWGSALGNKIQWMINAKMDSAEIRIDPPHLGKMDISIKMTDEGANIVIQTQLAATRDLVDAASQRLKDMLEQAGHERVDVDVSHQENRQTEQQFADRDEYNEHTPSALDANGHNDTMNAEIHPEALTYNRVGLDLFA